MPILDCVAKTLSIVTKAELITMQLLRCVLPNWVRTCLLQAFITETEAFIRLSRNKTLCATGSEIETFPVPDRRRGQAESLFCSIKSKFTAQFCGNLQ